MIEQDIDLILSCTGRPIRAINLARWNKPSERGPWQSQ